MTAVSDYGNNGNLKKRVEHFYDASNRWIGQLVDTNESGTAIEKRQFIQDGSQIALQFTDEDLTARYLWSAGVDQLLAQEVITPGQSTGETQWTLTDHLGSIRDLVDTDSLVIDHAIYDAFGNVLDGPTSQPDGDKAIDSLFGFTGRPVDEHTNLQNNLHRWYDSESGRWISKDPIGFAAGDANLYRYVGNGPTTRTDPSGLDWVDDWIRNPVNDWLDDNVREPLERNIRRPVNNWLDRNPRAAVERFKNGPFMTDYKSRANDSAMVAANSITFGLNDKASKCADAAWDKAVTEGDYIMQGAFYSSSAGGHASQALVALPALPVVQAAGQRYIAWQGARDLPYRVAVTTGVKASRFFATATQYGTVIQRSGITKFLQARGWQSHHWCIARSKGIHGAEGLRRITEAGWNLIPLPARVNNMIGNGGVGFSTTRIIVGSSPVLSGYGGYQVGDFIHDVGSWFTSDE